MTPHTRLPPRKGGLEAFCDTLCHIIPNGDVSLRERLLGLH